MRSFIKPHLAIENVTALGNVKTELIDKSILAIINFNPMNSLWDTNAAVINTRKGLLFIDSGFNPIIAEYIYSEAIRNFGDSERKRIILSHHHFDHSFGLSFFQERGVAIIAALAYEKCIKDNGKHYLNILHKQLKDQNLEKLIKYFSDIYIPKPDIFLDKDLSDPEFEVYLTPGHTIDGLSVFHKKSKSLIVGDCLMPQPIGTLPRPRIPIEVQIESINRLNSLDYEIIIQGHGPIIRDRKYISKLLKDLV